MAGLGRECELSLSVFLVPSNCDRFSLALEQKQKIWHVFFFTFLEFFCHLKFLIAFQ